MQPLYLSGLRMTIAGCILLAYLGLFDYARFIIHKKSLVYFFILAFFNIFLTFALELWVLQYISSIKVTFLYNLGPLITPFFSYFYFSETMTLKKWVGLAIGFVGALPALLNGSSPKNIIGSIGFLSFPELAVLAGVFSYCYGWVFMRKLVREHHYSPLTISAWISFFGGIMSLCTAGFVETWISLPSTPWFYVCFGLLIILGNFIAITLFALMFRYYTMTFVSFTSLLIPLLVAFYGYIFLGEHLSWSLIISIMIVTIGLYIFYQEELRQGYIIQRKNSCFY